MFLGYRCKFILVLAAKLLLLSEVLPSPAPVEFSSDEDNCLRT